MYKFISDSSYPYLEEGNHHTAAEGILRHTAAVCMPLPGSLALAAVHTAADRSRPGCSLLGYISIVVSQVSPGNPPSERNLPGAGLRWTLCLSQGS